MTIDRLYCIASLSQRKKTRCTLSVTRSNCAIIRSKPDSFDGIEQLPSLPRPDAERNAVKIRPVSGSGVLSWAFEVLSLLGR